jgi:hypothetical protein
MKATLGFEINIDEDSYEECELALAELKNEIVTLIRKTYYYPVRVTEIDLEE